MKSNHGEGRDVWSRRPSFMPRQSLTAEQLNAGSRDLLTRQQLINRAVHGYGVVLGYGLTVHDNGHLDLRHGRLELSGGLALDRYGRMLVWPGGRLGIDDIVGRRPEKAGFYTLTAHYAVRTPEDNDCESRAGRPLWTDEGVVFTLNPRRAGVDRRCPKHPRERRVDHDEYLNRRNGGLPGNLPNVLPSPDIGWYPREPGSLEDSCQGGWDYDPDPQAGVPLAWVKICDLTQDRDEAEGEAPGSPPKQASDADPGDCAPRYGFCPDEAPGVSEVRPLVYRNPLLYELTRCCDDDPPRVKALSWHPWIARGWADPVPWSEFEQWIVSEDGFTVSFTKPINPTTLHEASVFVTAIYQNNDGAWRSYRVPLSKLIPVRQQDKVMGIRLIPEREEWADAEVTGRRSHLVDGVRVEVTIRGQLVRDEFGRMLDARPLGADCRGHCQARPGGDLVSVFQVGAKARDLSVPERADDETTTDHDDVAEKQGK